MSVRQRSGEMGEHAPLFSDSRARAVLAAGMAKAAAVRTGAPGDVLEAERVGRQSADRRREESEARADYAARQTGITALERAKFEARVRHERWLELKYKQDLADADRDARMNAKRIANAWEKVEADDGRMYYWNQETGETTWVEPVPPLSRSSSEVGAKVEPVDVTLFRDIVIQEIHALQGRPTKQIEIQKTPLFSFKQANDWVAKQGNAVAWRSMLTKLFVASGTGIGVMIKLYLDATMNSGGVDYSGGVDSGGVDSGGVGSGGVDYSGDFLPPPWAAPEFAAAYNGVPGAAI